MSGSLNPSAAAIPAAWDLNPQSNGEPNRGNVTADGSALSKT
jgi:hypothetical protein